MAELTPQVQAQPGQSRSSPFESLPEGGVLRMVYPRFYDSSTDPVPRGRVYVTIRLVSMLSNGGMETRGVVWRGYLTTGHAPSSFPNLKIPKNYHVVCEAAMHSKAPANRIVRAFCWVELPDQGETLTGSGGYIHQDEPGSGSGESIVPDPVTGTYIITQVTNPRDRMRLSGMYVSLTTSATLGNRRLFVSVLKPDTTGTPNIVDGVTAPHNIPQSTSRSFMLNDGTACAADNTLQNMPNVKVPLGNGDRLHFELFGSQSGDTVAWYPAYEYWAMP